MTNPFNQVKEAPEEDDEKETPKSGMDPRNQLSSRNSHAFRMKKLYIPKTGQAFGPGIDESDSSSRPLGLAMHSMPKLINSNGIFNTGNSCKDGVIDIHSTYALIQKFQSQSSEYEGGTPSSSKIAQKNSKSQPRVLNNAFPYSMPPNANLTDEEKWKWNEIMKFFKKHPEILINLMPDDMNFGLKDQPSNFTFSQAKKTLPRKGQSMIPDLGVVPPQSGHLGLKRFEKEISHNRKRSQGDLKQNLHKHQKQQLYQINPSQSKYHTNDPMFRQNNTPSQTQFQKFTGHYFKPNTAVNRTEEYQSPSFIPANIVETVNKTSYKQRIADLQSRGKSYSNNSNTMGVKDTTILDKKSIIIESDTEDVAERSNIHSQVVKMQNTINLASDTTSEAPTKRKDSNEYEAEDEGEGEEKKRQKSTSEDQSLDRKDDSQRDQSDAQKIGSQESRRSEKMSETKVQNKEESKRRSKSPSSEVAVQEKREDHSKKKININPQLDHQPDQAHISQPESNHTSLHNIKNKDSQPFQKSQKSIKSGKSQRSQQPSMRKVPSGKISQADKSQKEVAPIPGDRPDSFLMSNDGDRSVAGFKSVSEDLVIEEHKSLKKDPSQKSVKIKENQESKIPVEESKSRKGSLKSVQENNEDEKEQTIYIKQTIESFRDSQHSQKLDEKEITYSMTIQDARTDPKSTQRTKTLTEKSSAHLQNPTKTIAQPSAVQSKEYLSEETDGEAE